MPFNCSWAMHDCMCCNALAIYKEGMGEGRSRKEGRKVKEGRAKGRGRKEEKSWKEKKKVEKGREEG